MSKADYELLVKGLRRKGITDESVLQAILSTPRELFMTERTQDYATEDSALPIECQQTISQPYIVARMSAAILHNTTPPNKVLEIGTGSGYQSAILAKLVGEVYTVERIEFLYHQAKQRLHDLDINNVHCHFGDGYKGWSKHAPYDAILVTAASSIIP
ncbi:MAG: protein-L-isoaspartate(D-aspartate) O-methyltransferase, partial [Pseudomonadota bacterium]|nr:protein-L-isoaspartate(D-aspartate) O-methyltransferase [Pseudomonadota bacterium]